MPYINIRNANIYYEDEGNGKETIVFAHSMLFNLRMFDDQVKTFKNDFRCVSFDFRGQGKSEITQDGYDLDSLTQDTVELMEALNCSPCHFIGFSMGGMVAMRLAINHPQLLKSLVLIDTSSEPESPSIKNKAMVWIAKYIGLGILANQVMEMFFGSDFLNDPNRKASKIAWKNHFLANDQSGIVKVIKGVLSRKGITDNLYKIIHPSLILVGENDLLTDYEKSEIMQKNIKNSSLKIIPRAAHMSPVEEPKIVNLSVQKFLLNHI